MSTRSKDRPGPALDVPPLRERLPEPDLAARLARARAALDRIDRITDETDTEEIWAEFARSIDAGRPHRPLFRGMY
jgi:hypothetical protein